MANEKTSGSEDTKMTDYANLAFNPYATSTDDLRYTTFGGVEPAKNDEPTKDGKAMANGGFEPEPVVEVNPHYEDTAEVAKKAGLSKTGGTGSRKKENIIYEAAGYKKKLKSQKRPEPPIRTSNIPPRPAEKWNGISRDTKTRWKLPFLVLCLLVLICFVGAAFGVLAYFKDEACSCGSSSPVSQKQLQGNSNSHLAEMENEFAKNFSEIFNRLDSLTALVDALQKDQMKNEKEIDETKTTMNSTNQEINQAIRDVNSTLYGKLQKIMNNISSLNGDVDELRNISKQMGPHGFNGTRGPQGPQGEPGIGNFSRCMFKEQISKGTIGDHPTEEKVEVTPKYTDILPGWKVTWAVCSTQQNFGAIQTVLSRQNGKYKCTCAGPSSYSVFKAQDNQKFMSCVIIYWVCPELT